MVNHNEKPLGIFIFWSFVPSALSKSKMILMTRWWQLKYFFNFHPEKLGKMIQFDVRIFFSDGLVRKPPTQMKCSFPSIENATLKTTRRLHNKSLTFSLSARSFFFPGAKKCPAFSWNIKGDKKEKQENKAR